VLPLPADWPVDCRPQAPRVGKQSFTIKTMDDGIIAAVVEVQLGNKKFYIKSGRLPFDSSRSIAWSKHGGVQEAWNHVVTMVGGWHAASAPPAP
jgi:hypothetical protein